MIFGLFHKSPASSHNQQIIFKLSGLHCTSCGLNIDGALEDENGVVSATTSYAKSETQIEFDPQLIAIAKLQNIVEDLGYQVVSRSDSIRGT